MNVQVLIDSIVRQVTVLVAQLSTSGGIRAPLSHIANQVFVELANELSAQGVSRKVSADMFGMALRAYIRKVQRLSESSTEQGRTLWRAVLDFLADAPQSRDAVLARFSRDDEALVRAVLHDLTDSGLVFVTGGSERPVYRAVASSELAQLQQLSSDEGLDELVWVLVYREGPIEHGALARLVRVDGARFDAALARLVASGRIAKRGGDPLGVVVYEAHEFSVPIGQPVGWEAAVLDHVQAVVQTICQRLSAGERAARAADTVGGSTYSFDVWPGHPLADEVYAQLARFRREHGELLARVTEHNRAHGLPERYEQVVTYGGQCVHARGPEEDGRD